MSTATTHPDPSAHHQPPSALGDPKANPDTAALAPITTADLERLEAFATDFRNCLDHLPANRNRPLGSLPQLQAFLHIIRHAGCTPTDLAADIDITPSSITGIVDRLFGAGLVERRHHRFDRRHQYLHPTPAAHTLLKRHHFLTPES